jgi:hypothetical protein
MFNSQDIPKTMRKFRQRDITRAVKAVSAAGVSVSRVDLKADGTVSIVTGESQATIPSESTDGWDVL